MDVEVRSSPGTAVMDQLTDDMKVQFFVVLTHKYDCDRPAVEMMSTRMLGKFYFNY